MKQYGLIGRKLGHSFSKQYFTEKFAREGIDAKYELYELAEISDLEALFRDVELWGLNVTIPYKEEIIPYLDSLDEQASRVGAVNVVRFVREDGGLKLKGYNSDVVGFVDSIKPHLTSAHTKALVLGTGGAAKAMKCGLEMLGLSCMYVSRQPKEDGMMYDELTQDVMREYTVVVNATPLGMYPNVDGCPPIPYVYVGEGHVLFDAVYNPLETLFLKKGAAQGAVCIGGLDMLHKQAEAAWKTFNLQ